MCGFGGSSGGIEKVKRSTVSISNPASSRSAPVSRLILMSQWGAYRAMHETFGRVVDDVDDERFVAAWVALAMAAARERGLA